MPSSSCQSIGGFFNFIEQQKAELQIFPVILGQLLLGNQRMSFAVAQVAGRRTDQLGDLMGVLKFRAIHFDDGPRVSEENFSGGLDDTRLARSSGAQKQQITYGPADRAHACAINLVEVRDGANALFLPDNLLAQSELKLLRFRAAECRVQLLSSVTGMLLLLPEVPLTAHTSAWSPVELVKLDPHCRVQKPELHHQFLTGGAPLRYIEQRREEISQIQIEIAESRYQAANVGGFGIKQVHAVVDRFAQRRPVHVHERVGPSYLTHHIVGDSRALPQTGQVKLLHLSLAAHVVHQIVGVPLASQKSHVQRLLP
jgi:hypothetical protein